MPILNLQRRQTEVGRIRIGQKVATANGKTRPGKLDRFRVTTASRELADRVAALYGGTVAPWESPAGMQWEVITDATSIPVVVPPQPISQWYELWSGGGCKRRCDGERDVLSDGECLCDPDPTKRECKPTTRLNVMLADVPSIGVWRLETHGYNAAIELPGVAELLAQAGGFVPARLELQQRTSKREKADGSGVETRQYMVPVLDVDVIPSQLLALNTGGQTAVGAGERQAIGAGPAVRKNWGVEFDNAADEQELKDLYEQAKAAGELTPALKRQVSAQLANLRAAAQRATGPAPAVETVDAEVVPAAGDGDPDGLWMQVLAAVPDGWSTSRTEQECKAVTGKSPEDADAADLTRFLEALKAAAA